MSVDPLRVWTKDCVNRLLLHCKLCKRLPHKCIPVCGVGEIGGSKGRRSAENDAFIAKRFQHRTNCRESVSVVQYMRIMAQELTEHLDFSLPLTMLIHFWSWICGTWHSLVPHGGRELHVNIRKQWQGCRVCLIIAVSRVSEELDDRQAQIMGWR